MERDLVDGEAVLWPTAAHREKWFVCGANSRRTTEICASIRVHSTKKIVIIAKKYFTEKTQSYAR